MGTGPVANENGVRGVLSVSKKFSQLIAKRNREATVLLNAVKFASRFLGADHVKSNRFAVRTQFDANLDRLQARRATIGTDVGPTQTKLFRQILRSRLDHAIQGLI